MYQMVWQQIHDATQKPFGRNNIYIDYAKKIEGFFIQDSFKFYNSKMGGVDWMDQL